MNNTLNAIAVTLLIGLVSIVPATLIGKHLPAIFDPGLRPVAVSGWIAALIAWYVSRKMTRDQDASQEAHRRQSSSGVAIAVVFLVVAVGVAVALHFFGGGLLEQVALP